ncbi:sensor domain-containing diguanylate cyclase [Candidatus Fermentibacteria bacterium]|nr:sensor domain-containing diguanylate cyclase [Candidatus Fermentibacteria bacterium]
MRTSPPMIDLGEREKLLACLEIGKALTSTLDLPEVLHLIMNTGSQIIAAENWSLLLRDPDTGELSFQVVVGLDPALVKDLRLPKGVGFVGYVAETGQPLYVPDARRDVRFNPDVDRRTGFVTRSVICLPLTVRGSVLGVVEVVNVEDVNVFQNREAPLLRVLTDYAAIAIENSRYVQRIQELTVTDEYTGLPNARYLYATLDELLTEARACGTPLSVAFADLDNFKQVVDTHGHLMGSRVLREVGAVMKTALTTEDILVKYGGDEYVILMPGRDKPEAYAALEDVRRAVAAARFLADAERTTSVTASIGVATFPTDGSTARDILLRADSAMYEAKKTKNTVAFVPG